MRESAPVARPSARRIRELTLLTLLPVAVAVALAGFEVWRSSGKPRLPCPLYPNAVVAFASKVHEGCPLEPGDAILGVEVGGRTEVVDTVGDLDARLESNVPAILVLRRAGETSDRRIRVEPVMISAGTATISLVASMVLAAVLLTAVLLTAVRASVPASLPFALIHSSVGVLMVAAVAGWTSPASYPLTALARAALPASLIHLAFVFPRTREVAIRVPGIHRVTYGVALGFLLLELAATYRGSASTMLLIQRILMAAVAVAITLLCFSSYLSIRESPSRLTRRQSRVFLVGLALLLAATLGGSLLDVPGGPLSALTLGAALSPLPLGYAIARYHLFDFGTTLRRAVAHVLYLSIWSGLFFLGIVLLRERLPIPEVLRNPVVLFAGVYGVLAPLDAIRHVLKRSIERAFQPESKTWAHLSEGRASQLAHLRDPDSIAQTMVALATDGIPDAGISCFLREGETFRLAHAGGPEACEHPGVAALCLGLSAGGDVVDLNRVDTDDTEAAMVYAAGVEVISVIATTRAVYGIMLVCPRRRGAPQPASHLAWFRMLGVHAAAALENSRLAERLHAAEEFASRGRMHSELAHEIGKPLGALEVLARRLAADAGASAGMRERAGAIARLAGQLREIVRGVLGSGRDPERVEVRDLIERACLEIANVHGEDAVCVRPLPALATLDRRANHVVRALTNLIDNAIRASAPGEAVEISAQPIGGEIEIAVTDRGVGIHPRNLERVFEPFVSLRGDGNGLGLTISRQIVEQLGGTLVLVPAPGRGTVAKLRLPVTVDEAGPQSGARSG